MRYFYASWAAVKGAFLSPHPVCHQAADSGVLIGFKDHRDYASLDTQNGASSHFQNHSLSFSESPPTPGLNKKGACIRYRLL